MVPRLTCQQAVLIATISCMEILQSSFQYHNKDQWLCKLGCQQHSRLAPEGASVSSRLQLAGAVSKVLVLIWHGVADPDLNAWYDDSDKNENADKCAWQWGSVTGNGLGRYNVHLTCNVATNCKDRDFLVRLSQCKRRPLLASFISP